MLLAQLSGMPTGEILGRQDPSRRSLRLSGGRQPNYVISTIVISTNGRNLGLTRSLMKVPPVVGRTTTQLCY